MNCPIISYTHTKFYNHFGLSQIEELLVFLSELILLNKFYFKLWVSPYLDLFVHKNLSTSRNMRKSYILYGIVGLLVVLALAAYLNQGIATPSSLESSGLVTSRISATLNSTATTERWEAVDGYAGRFPVNLGETLRLSFQLAKLDIGKPILIEAPHGGVLNGNQNHFTWTPQTADEPLELTYQVGRSTGVYLIALRQGNRTETIEFWAGEPKPLGEAGPQTLETK